MKRKQKRTYILGALIFLALVVLVGFGLAVAGNFHNPLSFLVGGMQQPGNSSASLAHSGSEGGPGAGNTSGIAWSQIGGVFFDLWVLSAIVAGYIFVQQILGLIMNRFRARNASAPSIAA